MPTRKQKEEAANVIKELSRGRVRAQCPHCEEQFPLRKANLFFLDDLTSEAIAWLEAKKEAIRQRRLELKALPSQVTSQSDLQAGAVNLGNILERVAPAMPTFPVRLTECRSLFDPIDYLAFPGADSGVIESIEFVELKSGNSRLNNRQKQVRDAVERGHVDLTTYTSGGTA
jgi:predicted Holliday junction resolvase-like endonuclease